MVDIKNILMKKYNSLNGKRKLLLAIIIILVIIILYHVFIKASPRGNEINYKKITAQIIIEDSTVEYDRGKISILNSIIENVFKLQESELMIEGENISKKQFYKAAVTNNYKNNLSFGKFKKKIDHISEKVYFGYKNKNMLNLKDIIKNVYYSPNYDMYLIELNENYEQENTYIGIRLITETSTYYIVYLE